MTCSTYVNPTQKFSDKKVTLETLSANIQKFEDLIHYQSNPIARFDTNLLIFVSQKLSSYLDFNSRFVSKYINLTSRLELSSIPKIELSDFILSVGLNLNTIDSVFTSELAISSNPSYVPTIQVTNILELLDTYYDKEYKTSTQSGFCNLFSDGAILKALGLLSAGAKLLSQLQNFSISDVIGKLNTIKELINQLIDKTIKSVLNKLTNITNSVNQISNKSIFNTLYKKSQSLKSMYSDTAVSNLKTRVEEILSKMAGQFKEITSEILEFILFRSCQLSGIIVEILETPMNNFRDKVNGIQGQLNVLITQSNRNRYTAVEAGGIRLSSNVILVGRENASQQINRISSNNTSGGQQSGQANAIPTYYITVEASSSERELASSIGPEGNQYISFTSAVINMEKQFPSANPANNVEYAGIRKVHPDVWIKIFRVAQRLGVKFTINSAYRNENKNNSLSNAASNSQHLYGMAIDVTLNGADRDTFIKYCSQEGFLGIGTYDTFIHVDLGNRRTWGALNNSSLSIHERDGFRSGV